MLIGTSTTALLYIIVGVFGFTAFTSGANLYFSSQTRTFISYPHLTANQTSINSIMGAQNILLAPYSTDGNPNNLPDPMYLCYFAIMFAMSFAIPFCVLPIKNSIETTSGIHFTP